MKYYDFLDDSLIRKTPFKKVIKSKIKSNKQLSDEEKERERLKYEIAEELGLKDKVEKYGWSSLTAKETGQIGGIMTRRNRDRREEDFKNGRIPKW